MKKFLEASLILLLMSGCGAMDVRNTIVMTLGKKSANDLNMSGYGYKNDKYLNLDVGDLDLKVAHSHHHVKADDVKIFLYTVPKSCHFIGWVTIENPSGLKDVGMHYGIGNFDTESYMDKHLKKAASLLGVKWLSQRFGKARVIKKGKYYIGYYGDDVIMVFPLENENESKLVRVSVKAYECD